MKYTPIQLREILTEHAEWLADNSKGARANLSYADLRGVDMFGVNLSHAELSFADLGYTLLNSANLSYASMISVNLNHTKLRYADLRHTNLNSANLSYTDMIGADLRGADMDYTSGIPLWCGGSKFKCEAELIQQVLAHLCTLDCKNKEWIALRKAIRPFAKKSHRAFDLGLVKQKKG